MGKRPLYFDGAFGWLHEASNGAHTMGAVLLSAFGQEDMCTHYGMMVLADELAARGVPALRFDARGFGDSADAAFTLASFAQDAKRPADTLRQECGVDSVVLIGLRMGAMAAMKVASEIAGLSGLVLMAPPVSGQAFLRETRAAAMVNQLANLDPVPRLGSGQPLNTNGFWWSVEMQGQVGAFDGMKVGTPTAPAMVLPARGDRRPGKLAEAWRTAGTPVTELNFDEYEAWMQDPTTSTLPAATFAHIVDWVSALTPRRADVAAAAVDVRATLRGQDFVEEPVMFGEGGQLSGVLCRPLKHGAKVAALLLHEGSSTHIGDGGAYVAEARMLASHGIASLRMDLTGMGDSFAGDNPRHPHYDPERMVEVRAGADVLEGAGYPKSVAFGLCSGAYTALQASIADERVVGSIAVNLQKFLWHYGDDIRVQNRRNKRTFRAYMRGFRNRSEWKRALKGDADFRGIVRVLATRAVQNSYHRVRGLFPVDPHSETGIVRRQMTELAKRGAHTHLIWSDDDPGLSDLLKHFGRKGKRLAHFAPANVVLLSHADHHFNAMSARKRYYEMTLQMMKDAIAAHGASVPKANRERAVKSEYELEEVRAS